MLPYNKRLIPLARNLRKRMTPAEVILWTKVRDKQLEENRFYRQRPIGEYIVDFYCSTANLVIEVDGSQHYTDIVASDIERDEYLRSLGLKVLRFNNLEVMTNIEGVVERILEELD